MRTILSRERVIFNEKEDAKVGRLNVQNGGVYGSEGQRGVSLGNEMNRTRFRYFPRRRDVSLAIENRIVTRSSRMMLRFSLTF